MYKALFSMILVAFVLFSCEETNVQFEEYNVLEEESAIIEINIPKALGETDTSKSINSTLEAHISNALNFSESPIDGLDLLKAIDHFNSEYDSFKSDIAEEAMQWEATFDGDVIYQSEEIITIALNSYMNTGGAHGNMNITLLNFKPENGNLLTTDELIVMSEDFIALAFSYFKAEIENEDQDYSEYFFGEDFHLPANIGFNDDGLLLLYNTYEIAPYSFGITEFTIPFEEAEPFLKLL